MLPQPVSQHSCPSRHCPPSGIHVLAHTLSTLLAEGHCRGISDSLKYSTPVNARLQFSASAWSAQSITLSHIRLSSIQRPSPHLKSHESANNQSHNMDRCDCYGSNLDSSFHLLHWDNLSSYHRHTQLEYTDHQNTASGHSGTHLCIIIIYTGASVIIYGCYYELTSTVRTAMLIICDHLTPSTTNRIGTFNRLSNNTYWK